MTPDERDEIEALANAYVASREGRCNAPDPYGVTACTREPGHGDRHWNDRLNWPAA